MSKDLFFGEIRSLLALEPSYKAFSSIWEVLGRCQDRAVLEDRLLPYVIEHLSSWGLFRHLSLHFSKELLTDVRLPLLEAVHLTCTLPLPGETSLKDFDFTETHLEGFRHLKHLSFDLGHASPRFQDRSWYAINFSSIASQLESLSLRGVCFDSIKHTPQGTLSNLKTLDVEFVRLAREDIGSFLTALGPPQKPTLKTLRLTGEEVDFNTTYLDPAPMIFGDVICRMMRIAASWFTELEHLDLSGSSLTGAGIDELCANGWLEKLGKLTLDRTPFLNESPRQYRPCTLALAEALRALNVEVA